MANEHGENSGILGNDFLMVVPQACVYSTALKTFRRGWCPELVLRFAIEFCL